MGTQRLVLAVFADETAADEAVMRVKEWDRASAEIKLGAIGVLAKNEKGEIKTHKMGARYTGTGAVLFALGAVLMGGFVIGLGGQLRQELFVLAGQHADFFDVLGMPNPQR